MTARIRARLEQQRRAAQDAKTEALAAALETFTGACRACLDSGTDYLSGGYCAACKRGAALETRDARAEEKRHAARIAIAYEHALATANTPEEYDTLTLETYPRKAPILGELRRFIDTWDTRRGLVLSGPYGVGKTALLCAVARSLALELVSRDDSARIRVRFYPTSSLLYDLRAAMSDRTGEYARVIDAARHARILILDDLGRANPGEWASETLFDLINWRYNARLPLLATTNYAEEALAARLGEHGGAIVDRLGERCVWLRIGGSSLRKRATLT